MNAFAYIIAMTIKNQFFELLRKPAKLILYLLVIVAIVAILIVSSITNSPIENYEDIVWLKGILFAFILFIFIMSIITALKSGNAIFDMTDVNFLFVSPIKSQTILLYGVVRTMGKSLLAGIFILFQGNTLAAFGVGFGGVMLVFTAYVLALSVMQILSLIVYSITNARAKRKTVMRLIIAALFAPMIVYAIMQFYQTDGEVMRVLENLLRSPLTSWTPIVGWTAEGTTAFIAGDIYSGILFLTAMLLTAAFSILYIMFSNPDYYEDTLVATETAFEKKRAASEGQIVRTDTLSVRKVKVAATGIGGMGVSSIFFKHLRESFRANRLGLWGITSIIIVLASALFAYIMSRENGTDGAIIILLSMLMFMQILRVGMGRGLLELYTHYIYLIPETSFKKIIWSNMEIVFKVFVESIAVFVTAGIIMGESLPVIIAVIIAFSLFSLLLIGVNYLSLRWTGADMSATILLLIYLIAIIIIMLPGVVAALIVGYILKGMGVFVGLLILATWELIAAAGCFALSKGILDNCDMPVMKTAK